MQVVEALAASQAASVGVLVEASDSVSCVMNSIRSTANRLA